MKALKKKIYDEKLGEVTVYELVDVPDQLRSVDISWYQKVILGNSDAFEYLKKVFVIAASMKNEKSIICIKINLFTTEGLMNGLRRNLTYGYSHIEL